MQGVGDLQIENFEKLNIAIWFKTIHSINPENLQKIISNSTSTQ